MKEISGGITAAKGFRAAGLLCNVRKGSRTKPDVALIVADHRCPTAAMYTTNKAYAAPIAVDKEHLADGWAQAIICNSRIANACVPGGLETAKEVCAIVAEAAGIAVTDVLPSSTGVIGEVLPTEPFRLHMPQLVARLTAAPSGSAEAAEAIMTTDTVPKEAALAFTLGGTECRLGVIGKGSGMIAPNMATMLEYYTTDVAITPALLQKALGLVVPETYNQLSVDRDTSTNDTVILMASGDAGNAPITEEGEDFGTFVKALHAIAVKMCRMHAGDGEGASHLIEVTVTGAPDHAVAKNVARSVVTSDLFKASVFGRDANWGRIMCAIGYTPGNFDISGVEIRLRSAAGEVLVCQNAAWSPYSEEEATRVLSEKEVDVLIDMHAGADTAQAWGCDLTYDYVKINGDYRS